MSSGLRVSLRERNAQKDALSAEGCTPLFNTTSEFKVEYHGCEAHDVGISDINNNIRQTRIRGKTGDVEQKSDSGVRVTPGSGGKSVISIGDDHFGLTIGADLTNTNVVVNTGGETQVISAGGDGTVNIQKKAKQNGSVVKEVEEKQETNISVAQVGQRNDVTKTTKKGPDVTKVTGPKGGRQKDVVTTTKMKGEAQVTETKTTEIEDEGDMHTEKKTTVTETKTPGGQYTRRTFESKTTVGKGVTPRTAGKFVEPKSGARKETASQRRARENRGVSAKNNPFKQQDKKVPVTKPAASGLPKAGQVGGASATQVDAASSNIEKLLKWIQKRVNQYPAVEVTNFTSSWEDGVALCALMNYLLGDEVLNPEDVSPTDKLKNFEMALKVATAAGVPALLQADELARGEIERRSMITYLHLVYTKLFADKQDEKKSEE